MKEAKQAFLKAPALYVNHMINKYFIYLENLIQSVT